MAGCRCAPALLALRDEFNEAYPERDKASDGCCASTAHSRQNPTSDHEPDKAGFAHAYDIDENLTLGTDPAPLMWLWDRWVKTPDPRIKYLIYERRIFFTSTRDVLAYRGVNAHEHHLHVSIKPDATHDVSPWLAPVQGPAKPPPDPVTVEDDAVKVTLVPLVQHDGPWWVGWVATPLAVAATLHGPELDTDPVPTVGGPWRYLVDAGAVSIQDRGPEGDRPQRAVVTVELPYAMPGDEILVRVAHA